MKRSNIASDYQKSRSYSPAVITEGGRTIWLAGHLAWEDEQGNSLADDFDHQTEKWIPSMTFAVTVHEEDTDLVSDNSINFSFDDSRSRTLASLRFGAELMSPTFDDLPAKPRFFGFAGVLWSTPGNGVVENKHETTLVEDYRDINLDQLVRNHDRQEFTSPGRPITVDDFQGQGTHITGRQLHNAWFLGVGTVFTFPMRGFSVRVRPTLEYVAEEIKTEGEYTLLTEPIDNVFVINDGMLKDTNIDHNLGPGLELEFVNHLDSNVTLAFFTQARFLWIVNSNVAKSKLSTVLPYNQPTIQRKNPYSPRFYYTGQILCVKANHWVKIDGGLHGEGAEELFDEHFTWMCGLSVSRNSNHVISLMIV